MKLLIGNWTFLMFLEPANRTTPQAHDVVLTLLKRCLDVKNVVWTSKTLFGRQKRCYNVGTTPFAYWIRTAANHVFLCNSLPCSYDIKSKHIHYHLRQQRCFNVYTTSIKLEQRHMNVKMTFCSLRWWVSLNL